MTPLRIVATPDLREPLLIAAFSGWSDAGAAASAAAQYLIDRWRAPLLAEIDPEEFYDFTQLRPTVHWVGETRKIEWPQNNFHYHRTADRDFVIFCGIEPHLRWRAYVDAFHEVIERFHVSTVITLGALLVDFPHTRPVRVTGTAPTEEMAARAGLATRGAGRYEGPTGISGVLTASLRERQMPIGSIWANVPHYVSATPNPTASLAILQASAAFKTQLEEATSKNAEVSEYVRALEERVDAEEEAGEQPRQELPPVESILQDVEEFFRKSRDDDKR
jgi:proteasome assembly chaperone (PAC2) family protein